MRLEAHKANDKLLLRVYADDYDHASAVRNEVRGSRYVARFSDRDGGIFAFTYPLSVDVCRQMREAWGTALKVESSLSQWYRGAAQQRAAQAAITTQGDAHLPRLAKLYPAFNAWLKGDQRVTAKWVAGLYRDGGVLADEVGTGKTAGVIAGLVERGVSGNVLVVCPRISVKAVWGKEFAQHVPDVPVFLCRGSRKAREATIQRFLDCEAETAVLVIVAEMLRIKSQRAGGRIKEVLGYQYPELFQECYWDGIIVDESQKLFGSLDVVRANDAGEGIRRLPQSPECFKLAVSATPFGKGGKIERLFGTLHWVWPDEFTSKWGWLERFFYVVTEKVYVKNGGGATKTVNRIQPPTPEQEAAFWESLSPRVLRRTMEEVSPAHRGLKNYIEVACEMEPAQRMQYERFAQDAELAVDGGIVSAVGTLDFLTRCRQFANGELRKEGGRVVYTGVSGKFEMMMKLLDELAGRKVVIASQYNEFLDAAQERLYKEGYWDEYVGHAGTHHAGSMVRLDGSTSEAKREAYMHLFQEDKSPRSPRLFLLNSQAGGVSITLDAADAMICLDEMSADAMTQLMGRIFRRGRVHEVFYYLLRSIGTVDEQIGYNVGQRHEEQFKLLDGRRGLEYARNIAKYRGE